MIAAADRTPLVRTAADSRENAMRLLRRIASYRGTAPALRGGASRRTAPGGMAPALRGATISISLVFSTWFALCVPADAQGVIDMGGMSDQEAKSHFKVGKSLYETGRFSEAATEFEKAYALSNKVELLYNVYVAHRDASDLPRAIDALRRYLELAQIDDSTRVNLQARLRAMEEANGRAGSAPVAGAAPAGPAQPVVDGQPQSTAPPSAPQAEPAPVAAPPPGTVEYEVDAQSSALPYALVGIGAAVLAAGAVTAVLAAGKISDIEDACEDDLCPPPSAFDLEGERDSARTLRTIAFALLGGGIVVGGAGVALLLLDSDDATTAEAGPQAAMRCAPDGCIGTVSGRF
jgi:tetratricopeptide (TPR) repeat protein